MNSRERVLAVLKGELPDRLPWIENYVSNEVMKGLLGHDDFDVKCTYSQKIDFPGMIRVSPDLRKIIPLDNISYDLAPPRFAKTEKLGGHDNITEGLIKTKEDLRLLDALPDPDDESLYRPAEEFLRRYKDDSAAIITVRSGPGNTYLSMGIDHFCMSIMTEPELVKEILWRFSNWTKRVVKNVQELPFDLFFTPDDIGFGAAPMISPAHFREFCVPVMKNVFDEMRLPVIYHSDGNIMPIMEDIIALGVAGVANMEPGPMDIVEVKKRYGHLITIVGNIDLHYTLTKGTPEETKQEVKERILALAPGGHYLLASANSLPNYVKPENVRAMGEALLEYGDYGAGHLTASAAPAFPEKAAEDQAAPAVVTPESGHGEDAYEIHMKAIQAAIIDQEQGEIPGRVTAALDAGIPAETIINDAMITAMDTVGKLFSANEIFVPEMLISANIMKQGVALLQPFLKGGASQSRGKIMIATVKGDLHDIGKNIVSLMLEGGGFEVIDLGINIDGKVILEKIREHKPDILALSALLTTTLSEMGNVIRQLRDAGLKDALPVMVGGAPVSQKFADEIGADGYSRDAAGAVKLARTLMPA